MSRLTPEQGRGPPGATVLPPLLRKHLFSLNLLLTMPGMHSFAFELSYKSPIYILLTHKDSNTKYNS